MSCVVALVNTHSEISVSISVVTPSLRSNRKRPKFGATFKENFYCCNFTTTAEHQNATTIAATNLNTIIAASNATEVPLLVVSATFTTSNSLGSCSYYYFK